MKIVVVTGAGGLVGSESVRFFAREADLVIGIDNDMRRQLFGEAASTNWCTRALQDELGERYRHIGCDIRDAEAIDRLFEALGKDIALVIHAAAQPSHDWAARDPQVDFTINANGTLNLLEATRKFAPNAVFIFTSTNKVYGDAPNRLPLIETETRWSVERGHPYAEHGIGEDMSIDQSLHSLFGASKVAADVLVQEYGRYFGLKTGVFRGGCLTGPNHSGAQLHGFLSYLMKCCLTGEPYTVFGYKAKQVRDNIHSADLVRAFAAFAADPDPGAVYNIGGGVFANCSMVEAIGACESVVGRSMRWSYAEGNRTGDHIWYVSDLRRFLGRYPGWSITYGIRETLEDIAAGLERRLSRSFDAGA